IYSFIAASIAQLKDSAGRLLSFTVGLSNVNTVIACSIAAVTSYTLIPKFVVSKTFSEVTGVGIAAPYVEIEFAPRMDMMSALCLSIVIGVAASWGKSKIIADVVVELKDIIDIVIQRFIIPIIPIFIFCIFAGITAKGEMSGTVVIFGKMLVLIIMLQLLWLIIEYTLAAIISKTNPLTAVRKMMP